VFGRTPGTTEAIWAATLKVIDKNSIIVEFPERPIDFEKN